MKEIPLIAIPSQTLNFTAGYNSCQLTLSQKSTGLFCDITLDGTAILNGVACLDQSNLVRGAHLGFPGDLIFVDTQGTNDPDYTGLGDRYRLLYLEESDLWPS